jgi:hypothetical protein
VVVAGRPRRYVDVRVQHEPEFGGAAPASARSQI